MTQIDVSAEWQKLCDEHEVARAAYLQAFAVVNQNFVSIAHGIARTNSTEDDLLEFDKTWQAWEDVKRRMHIFVKQYA